MVDNAPRFVVTVGLPARRICDASSVFCASSGKERISSSAEGRIDASASGDGEAGRRRARVGRSRGCPETDAVPLVTTRDVRPREDAVARRDAEWPSARMTRGTSTPSRVSPLQRPRRP